MTPQEFGDLIRAHREAKGFTIDAMVSRFKLSVQTAHGIESGNLDGLPHSVYAKGFVRAYAQAVGVSAEDLATGLAGLFPEEEQDTGAVPGIIGRSSARPRNKGRSGSFLFFLFILALLGGGGWFVYTNPDFLREFAPRVVAFFSEVTRPAPEGALPEQPTPPARTEEVPAVPVAPAAPVTAPEASVPVSGTSDTDLSQPQESTPGPVAESSSGEPAVAPPPARETSLPAPVTPAEQLPISGNHVAVVAAEECWIQVAVDGGGSRTFTVYPGETSVLPYKNKITILLGNAGGVALSHNGKPHPLNGRRNEKRTISF